MKEKLEKYIRSFQLLTDDEIKLIIDSTNYQSFKKGHILLEEGQISKKCYFILEGCIREFYLKDGIEKSTAFHIEGDSVSSFSSAVNNIPSRHYMVCAEDCMLTVSDQNLENEMCEKIPRLRSIILEETEKITGKKQDELADFITSTPEERYINLINEKPNLFNRVPQHQIASFLGVTPESLSRIRKRILSKSGS